MTYVRLIEMLRISADPLGIIDGTILAHGPQYTRDRFRLGFDNSFGPFDFDFGFADRTRCVSSSRVHFVFKVNQGKPWLTFLQATRARFQDF